MIQEAARAWSPFACERPCPPSASQGGGQENWQVAEEKGDGEQAPASGLGALGTISYESSRL